MKHKFTKEEVKKIELAGLDLDKYGKSNLDGLYEILKPLTIHTEVSMTTAIESVGKIVNQFKLQSKD